MTRKEKVRQATQQRCTMCRKWWAPTWERSCNLRKCPNWGLSKLRLDKLTPAEVDAAVSGMCLECVHGSEGSCLSDCPFRQFRLMPIFHQQGESIKDGIVVDTWH